MIATDNLAQSDLSDAQVQAVTIVRAIYGKDWITEADLKLASCMSFIRFFQLSGRRRVAFYEACMADVFVGK